MRNRIGGVYVRKRADRKVRENEQKVSQEGKESRRLLQHSTGGWVVPRKGLRGRWGQSQGRDLESGRQD